MIIDTHFKVYSDANGGDPDKTSPTLRKYHKILWSKPLPNGKPFALLDNISKAYLFHKSELGEFILGSDGIAHSYDNRDKLKPILAQVEIKDFYDDCSTIGGYILFPCRQTNRRMTINQARGIFKIIDDRFDLTLECIRRYYLSIQNPLYEVFMRYKSFFNLFSDFHGYVDFFLLNDLIEPDGKIKFYLPFDDFKTAPGFSDVNDYLLYKERVTEFVMGRNERIEKYSITLPK